MIDSSNFLWELSLTHACCICCKLVSCVVGRCQHLSTHWPLLRLTPCTAHLPYILFFCTWTEIGPQQTLSKPDIILITIVILLVSNGFSLLWDQYFTCPSHSIAEFPSKQVSNCVRLSYTVRLPVRAVLLPKTSLQHETQL